MKNIGIFLLVCFLHSCQGGSNSDSLGYSYEAKEADFEEQTQPSGDLKSLDRKIIKTADIRFQVTDLEASTKKLEHITEKYSGFISSMNQTNSNYELNNYVTVRIPSEKLDTFISEIEKESIFTNYKRTKSEDVSEEFVDITTRMTTKKEVRDRYIDILRNKAKTVQDVLDAEDKIRVVQEEIESIEGRLKYLNNQISLSTVNVELYQEVPYVSPPNINKKPFLAKIKQGFSNGWDLVLNIIVGLVTIWPIILILIFLFLIRGYFKPFSKKKP